MERGERWSDRRKEGLERIEKIEKMEGWEDGRPEWKDTVTDLCSFLFSIKLITQNEKIYNSQYRSSSHIITQFINLFTASACCWLLPAGPRC